MGLSLQTLQISATSLFVFTPRYAIQTIPLHNPTNETLELQVRNNNPGNFVVEMNESSSVSTVRK